jgi:hypothetical protein
LLILLGDKSTNPAFELEADYPDGRQPGGEKSLES